MITIDTRDVLRQKWKQDVRQARVYERTETKWLVLLLTIHVTLCGLFILSAAFGSRGNRWSMITIRMGMQFIL